MKQGDLIKRIKIKKGVTTIDLDRIYPIGDVKGVDSFQKFIADQKNTTTQYANKLIVESNKETTLEIYMGLGYVALEESKWTDRFLHSNGWSGGDGIFSFNIENGNDAFDQDKTHKTLMVFGDTFVGRSNEETHQRLQPHLMINNSIAYLENDNLSFHMNTLENGSITGWYHLDDKFDKAGTTAFQLIDELAQKRFGYVSGYYPKDLKINFDFHKARTFTHVVIENYFNEESKMLSKRGVKDLEIYGSNDEKSYELIAKATLKISDKLGFSETIKLKGSYRYIQLRPLTNYNDQSYNEGLFGLNKVYFYNNTQHYKDIYPSASSTLMEDSEHSWIWLQDGAVIGDTLFFYPFIVNSDPNQPEGLQFRIVGITQFATKIKNGKLDFSTTTQKRAPLLRKKGLSEWLFGAGLFANTKQAGSLNPDGYLYLYGMKTTYGYRELVVSRVKAENYMYFDDYEFFSDGKWVTEITEATPILGHVSAELSVTELREGHNKGKFMCVFTYDVNTPQVAFAIGETPWGPFSEPQTIYLTPEQAIFKSTTYTYNAKAHPHLSSSKKILVTYNCNTYSFDHNMSDYRIYRPRFLSLNDTE